MKTTLDLPEELIREVELRAAQTGKQLPEAYAELLRSGLQSETPRGRTVIEVTPEALAERRAILDKFVSGEWSVEFPGYEESREADRREAEELAKAWQRKD